MRFLRSFCRHSLLLILFAKFTGAYDPPKKLSLAFVPLSHVLRMIVNSLILCSGRLGWAGLGWAGLAWPGLGWAGLGWLGLAWAGLSSATIYLVLVGS